MPTYTESVNPMKRRLPLLVLSVGLLMGLSAACVPVQPSTPPAGQTDTQPESPGHTLRVALLPTTDVVPFYVAQQIGAFTSQGLTAEAVPVSSAAERDTVIQTGAADCEMTDVQGVVLTNARQAQPLRIIATARQATAERPLFFLLSAPESGITSADQLAGANIGTSENTVIDYWFDRVLAAAGVDLTSVTRTNVPQLPVRLELLLNQQLDAAILPDPLASLAQLQGATMVLDDTILPEAAVSVLVCRADVIAAQPDAVAAFLAGWDQAVEAINADPAAYADILIETARVPEPLQGQYTLPPFPVKQIPSDAQVQDVVDWAVDKGLIDTPPALDTLIDPSFRQ
ncbi:MAG: hypothetical protein DCC57_07960 [Chloroflexi bacterium]|nr:MAG: hypothetical protein DCC57_07960 [Chloroflexota bacterium]